jgi:hypothetical protein
MKINRESFNEKFSDYSLINWLCPSCKSGHVTLKVKSIKTFEITKSKEDQVNEAWMPDWIKRHLIGTMICSNTQCKEVFTIAGKIQYEENPRATKEPYYIEYLYIQYVFPVIPLFPLPDNLPYEIIEAIEEAFKLFWINKSACANAIRTAVELLLTDKRIKKIALTKNKKRRMLSLHERIELFKEKKCIYCKSTNGCKMDWERRQSY